MEYKIFIDETVSPTVWELYRNIHGTWVCIGKKLVTYRTDPKGKDIVVVLW